MCGVIKNSGKEQTFHGERVAREHGKDTGRRFYDLMEADIAEKTLLAAAVAGVNYYGPNIAQISRERERLLREQAEKEVTAFERAMTYACQMMQKENLLDNGKRKSNS
jgi:hypothetical protein